jgi:hypothetical protein
MPIVMMVLVLIVVAALGCLAYWGCANHHIWVMALIPGLAVGFLIWAATIVRLPFPIAAIVLVVIAVLLATGCWWGYRSTEGAFTRLLGVSVVTIAALCLTWYGLLSYWVNLEVTSELQVLNPGGATGTALVVYHPGKSSFQRDVSYAFAEGLVAKDWCVEITTASSQAPTDLSGYDLLVLGAPTYDWLPAKRLRAYVNGLGDLSGKRTVTIIAGAGYTVLSQPAMERLVEEAGGKLVKSLAVWSMAPIDEVYGVSDPLEAMRQSASDIPAPQK